MAQWYIKSKGFWGGVILILVALYYAYLEQLEQAATLFGAGLSLIGIRHAIQKIE